MVVAVGTSKPAATVNGVINPAITVLAVRENGSHQPDDKVVLEDGKAVTMFQMEVPKTLAVVRVPSVFA